MAANDLASLTNQIVEDLWNRGEVDQADRLISSTYVNHGGLIPDLVPGPEAVKLSVVVSRLAFPRLHITVESLVVQEESVAVRWSARNGHVAKSGLPTDALEGMTLGRFVGRKLAESWTYWDHEPASPQPKPWSPGTGNGSAKRAH